MTVLGGATAPAGMRRRDPRWRERAGSVALPAAGLAVALGFFELAPRMGVLPRASFPPVSETFLVLGEMLTTAELWTAVRDTFDAWARAMLLATLIAVPLGFLIGASRIAALVTRFAIEFLRPIPSVAMIPVFMLIYGTRPSLKVALAVFAATFPLMFQAMYGIRDVDPVAKETGRAFRLSWFDRLRHIVLPSCAPYLATGLRISASVALILVVTGEYVVGISGLGQQVLIAQSGGAYDRMYALIIMSGLLGLLVNLCFYAAERRALFWHPSHRGAPGGRS